MKKKKNILSKFVEKFKNFSNAKIYLISICLTSAMTYKYGANRFLYMEHNGHFNSPQNMLNRKVFHHHLQEIFLRFGFGVGGISAILLLIRGYLRIGELDKEIEKKNDLNKERENLELTKLIGNKVNMKNFEFKDDFVPNISSSDSDKRFNLDEMIKNKKIVDEYFKDRKN